MKSFFKVVLLSLLVFCTVSFLTVLNTIHSPLTKHSQLNEFKIGFPFTFYKEFIVDCPYTNFGWNLKNLMFDYLLIFTVLLLLYFAKNKIIKKI